MAEALPPLSDQVFEWLSTRGGRPAGPPFWRYRVINMAALLDIEVGVATTDLVEPEGEVVTGMLPAGRYASVEHTGHPDSLMAATRELLDWASRTLAAQGRPVDKESGDEQDGGTAGNEGILAAESHAREFIRSRQFAPNVTTGVRYS